MPKIQRKKGKESIDFIGIGAQRAGTTWLHHRLNELTEFSLPPIKELHYFDRNRKYPSPDTLAEPLLHKRIKEKDWIVKVIRTFGRQVINLNFKNIAWLSRLHFSKYSDDWYLSLFKALPGQGLKGEITPSYAILEEGDVQKMYELLPHIKIIFLLRNPVDRAWSHYRYTLKKYPQKAPAMQTPAGMIGFFNRAAQELRSDYLRTLHNYKQFYKGDQILIGFYDAIKEQPEQLLSDIVQFVGGDPSRIIQECNLSTRDNSSPKMIMPPKTFEFLKEKYYDMIRALSDTFGGYCTTWYEDLYDHGKKPSILHPFPATILSNETSNNSKTT